MHHEAAQCGTPKVTLKVHFRSQILHDARVVHRTIRRVDAGDIEVDVSTVVMQSMDGGKQRRLIFDGAEVTDVKQPRRA